MRLECVAVTNSPPIEKFEVNNLSDLVVIAGANGAGKTRLINQILGTIQSPRGQRPTSQLRPLVQRRWKLLGAASCDQKMQNRRVSFKRSYSRTDFGEISRAESFISKAIDQ